MQNSLIIDISNAHGGSGLRGPCHVRLRVGYSYQSRGHPSISDGCHLARAPGLSQPLWLRPVVKEQPTGHAPRHVPPVLLTGRPGAGPYPGRRPQRGRNERCDSEVQDFSSLPRAGRNPFCPDGAPPVGAPLRTCAGATHTIGRGRGRKGPRVLSSLPTTLDLRSGETTR